MKFSDTLLQDLAPFHLLKHPFYQAWMAGELTGTQLQNYAVQYYPHVLAFPRYVSAVHSLCEDTVARRELAMNLADEEGLAGGEAHPELWLRFAEGVGANRETVTNAQTAPLAQKMCDGFQTLSRSSYGEGLSALFAYEYQIPEIATSKIEGLQKHYAVTNESGVEFFAVHEKADLYHSEACKAALDRLPASEQEAARAAAVQSAKLLWDFLSEAYAVA